MHVSWVDMSRTLQTCIWLKTYFCRHKSFMVAERLLDRLLPETEAPPPLAPALRTMTSQMLSEMAAANEEFIPTYIPSVPTPGESVDGSVILELTCKALLSGQALMMVGGYIVRGIMHSCGKRATAIRRPDEAFEMVRPGTYHFALMDATRQTSAAPLALMDATHQTPAATAAEGIGNQVLAITNTPSPEAPKENLLPRMDEQEQLGAAQLPAGQLPAAQAQLDTAQLPPVQERIQILKKHKLNDDDEDRQKAIDDNEIARLNKKAIGKQPIQPDKEHDDIIAIINALLERVAYLEANQNTGGNNATSPKTPLQIFAGGDSTKIPLQVPIDTQKFKITNTNGDTDPIRGNGDSWLKSMGHEELGEKIHKWAVEVMETGKWPKPQVLAGSITDVIGVVEAEIDRIKREKRTDKDNNLDDMMQVAQQYPCCGSFSNCSVNFVSKSSIFDFNSSNLDCSSLPGATFSAPTSSDSSCIVLRLSLMNSVCGLTVSALLYS